MQLRNSDAMGVGLTWELLRPGKPGKVILKISQPFLTDEIPVKITTYGEREAVSYDALWCAYPVGGDNDLRSVFRHPTEKPFTLMRGVESLLIDEALLHSPVLANAMRYEVCWLNGRVYKWSSDISLHLAMLIADNLDKWKDLQKEEASTRFYLEKEKATGKYFLYGHQYVSRSNAPMRLPVTLTGDDPVFQLQNEHVGLYGFGDWNSDEIANRIVISFSDLYGKE